MPKKVFKNILKTFMAIALAGVLVFSVDWEKSWGVAKSVDPMLLAVYIGVLVLGIAISASKWKYLTDFLGFSFSWGKHFHWYLAGTFVNNFLPSVIGGDTYRVVALGKMNASRASAAASVFFDRYTGLVAMAMLAVVFSICRIDTVFEYWVWTGFLIAAILGVLVQIFFFPGWKFSILELLLRLFPKKSERMKEAMEQFSFGSGAPSISLLWGAVFSFIGVGVANYILFRALGAPIEFLDFLSVIFFINIIASVPISINNIGVKEWAYYVFFGFLGVAPEVSVTAAILSRFAQMLLSLFGIPSFFARNDQCGKPSGDAVRF